MEAQEQPSSDDDCDGMIGGERGWCWLVGGCCSFVPSLSRCLLLAASSLLLRYISVSLGLSLSYISYLVSLVGDIVLEIGVEREEMEDDTLDRDPRIKLSIGTKEEGDADGQFYFPRGLVFDQHRDLLLVVDSRNHRVQVFSQGDDEGFSFVSKFGEQGEGPLQFDSPWGIAIDHDHDRIITTHSCRVQVWSASDQSFLSCVGKGGSGDLEFASAHGIAIDKHHHRIIIADFNNNRVVFLSLIDLSFLFSVGGGYRGSLPGEVNHPSAVAIDHERHRIIVADSFNHRVQVWSLIDGSFLFEFGSYGKQPGQFALPLGVCVANQGRIIVAEFHGSQLQAFTHEGHHISSFRCGCARPCAVAFDEHRGLIAFTAGNRVHVIGANQWLADTKFVWLPDLHRHAPSWIKQAVSTMTMIRSLVDESSMSMIPNELLFEIFSFL